MKHAIKVSEGLYLYAMRKYDEGHAQLKNLKWPKSQALFYNCPVDGCFIHKNLFKSIFVHPMWPKFKELGIIQFLKEEYR